MSEEKKSPYTKTVSWHFEILDGRSWSVTRSCEDYIDCEDLRKNGQEDTHLYAELAKGEDGKWVMEEACREKICEYEGPSWANALEAFFNEHGPPPVE